MPVYHARLSNTTYTAHVPNSPANVVFRRKNFDGETTMYIPRELLMKVAIDLLGDELMAMLRKKLLR